MGRNGLGSSLVFCFKAGSFNSQAFSEIHLIGLFRNIDCPVSISRRCKAAIHCQCWHSLSELWRGTAQKSQEALLKESLFKEISVSTLLTTGGGGGMGQFLPDHTQQEIQPSQTLQSDSCNPQWPRTQSLRQGKMLTGAHIIMCRCPALSLEWCMCAQKQRRMAVPGKERSDRNGPRSRTY